MEVYARGFDGWGAWATAPLFLIPGLLGLTIGVTGVARCVRDLRQGNLQFATAVYTAVAALPVAWLLVRRHFV